MSKMSKINNKRIKPHFSIIAHTPDSVELRSGVWNRVSYTIDDETQSGKLFKFMQLLDGSHSLSEITQLAEMPRSDAEGIIDHLNQLNVLEDNSSTAFDYYADIYAPAFKNKQLPNDEILIKKIFILANDDDLGMEIKQNLTFKTPLSNIELISTSDAVMEFLISNDESWLHNALQFEESLEKFTILKDQFVIMAFDHINPVLAKRFNRIAHALDITWIHAAIDGPFVFIGPTFQKHQTACYECFETRVGINLREYNSYQKYKNAIANNQIIREAVFPMQEEIS
jgi:thiazole/oxazole-forming peptide maturase SagC family component